MEYVYLGKIVNTFGIKGDLKIDYATDFIKERFKKDSKVYIGEEHILEYVNNYHLHKGFLMVSFKDKLDINLVEKYKNMNIYKAKEDIEPLKNGEYFFSDLRGLDAYVDGKKVGQIINVEEGIRCNYLRVKTLDNKEHLVPYLPSFIDKVELDKNILNIANIEGLL